MKRYVIIGNGSAAVGCIEGIRSVDRDGEITVISKEKHSVYSRPLISYYLEGKTDIEHMKYRSDSFYEDNGCQVLYGVSADSINKNNKSVSLDNDSKLSYDSLCVATGSEPFIPPFEGLETVENKFSFMTLDDTLALESALTEQSRVLIVGAGLIGLKCAEGIRNRVSSITVCDLADRILSSILDSDCASIVQKHLEKNGIKFMLSDTAVRLDKNTAYMKSGDIVNFDILVLAVGVKANTALIKNAGGSIKHGIVVNKKMETDIPFVWAAGDCAEVYDASLGESRVLAVLPNAYIGGNTAGVNMAGDNAVFDNAIPMNSIGFFGYHIMTAGSYDGELIEEKSDSALKRFFVKNNTLIGFILLGGTDRAGIYTSLVREKTPLDTVDFELTKRIASNMIYPKEIRRKKFGSVV